MATEQAYYALVAYIRFLAGNPSLYDMNDIGISSEKAGYEFRRGETPDPGVTVVLNGKKLGFDQPPTIENSRVLVPMRKIFEAFDASVEWDQAAATAVAVTPSHTVSFTVGSSVATVNGVPYDLDAPVTIMSSRTMIPLRFFSQSLGASVSWYGGNKVVVIST